MMTNNNNTPNNNIIDSSRNNWNSNLNKVKEDRQKYYCNNHTHTHTHTDDYNDYISKNNNNNNNSNNNNNVDFSSSSIIFFINEYRPLFVAWNEQMIIYYEQIIMKISTQVGEENAQEKPTNYKEIVLETRKALRFGLCCCSFFFDDNSNNSDNNNNSNNNNNKIRQRAIQDCVIIEYNWHRHLLKILLSANVIGGDSKCRVLSAQLLSNCITSNSKTASIVSSSIPLSPSEEQVNASILFNTISENTTTTTTNNNNNENDSNTATTTNTTTTSTSSTTKFDSSPTTSWVDILLSCSKSSNREALAATVATLHNCIVALQQNDGDSNSDSDSDSDSDNNTTTPEAERNNNSNNNFSNRCSFANEVASNPMLINTLMRQFIDGSSVVINRKQQQHVKKNDDDNDHPDDDDDNDDDVWDSATEWIYLLVVKLSKLGLFRTMYHSIFAVPSSQNNNKNPNYYLRVLPEQNILLHCIVKEVDAYAASASAAAATTSSTYDQSNNQQKEDEVPTIIVPLGGELGIDCMKESCKSLANFLCRLLEKDLSSYEEKPTIATSNTTTGARSQDDNDDDDDILLLRRSAITSLLEVFAILFGVDNVIMKELRSYLGINTNLLQCISKHLGLIIDDLNAKSLGLKAREIKLNQEEQSILTLLVRLIGNLCYCCRYNQDLLRFTLVPIAAVEVTTTTTTTTNVTIDNDGNSSNTSSSSSSSESRNAIHVLLSSTTYATSCFTLREWSVIAIRNVLESNTENQDLVAKLDAQNPVQSAALNNAGVRVNLDSRGKVSLMPLKEETTMTEEEQEEEEGDT